MDIKFNCPICHKHLALDESCVGRKVQCPFCNNVFTLESPIRKQTAECVQEHVSSPPDDGTKRCPMCGELIQRSAKKCRFCGEYLNFDQRHTVVSGPNGERLFSKSTYNGEQPVRMPANSHEFLCFWLGFLFGISIIGILIAYLIGGKEGLVASLKGVLASVLVWVVVCLFIGGCSMV